MHNRKWKVLGLFEDDLTSTTLLPPNVRVFVATIPSSRPNNKIKIILAVRITTYHFHSHSVKTRFRLLSKAKSLRTNCVLFSSLSLVRMDPSLIPSSSILISDLCCIHRCSTFPLLNVPYTVLQDSRQ
ncbi:hypothetical protein E1B28_007122 [Marasmius oreades]|uniref:Uncharacterized protein n=1 Tax=Marasmius oreades TaxID=181124 RepID=A0A9P7S0Z8_9AGAR|nr:uncharacterized protein E1B28_007122 [Marasmius oreades]KAG7093444.1 hypothetical protein E1B28_007122 [Marasmius oreades]